MAYVRFIVYTLRDLNSPTTESVLRFKGKIMALPYRSLAEEVYKNAQYSECEEMDVQIFKQCLFADEFELPDEYSLEDCEFITEEGGIPKWQN